MIISWNPPEVPIAFERHLLLQGKFIAVTLRWTGDVPDVHEIEESRGLRKISYEVFNLISSFFEFEFKLAVLCSGAVNLLRYMLVRLILKEFNENITGVSR